MSRQLDWYYRNREKILARRRSGRKNVKTDVKTNISVKTPSIRHTGYVEPAGKVAMQGSEKRLYLHKTYYLYPKLGQEEEPVGEQHQLPYSRYRTFSMEGISCRSTTKSFIVEGIQLWGALTLIPARLLAYASVLADGLAMQYERETHARLDFEHREAKEHYEMAITNHDTAERITKAMKGKVWLYVAENGKIVYTDRTPDPASVESDSARLLAPVRELTEYLERRKWSAREQLALNAQFQENFRWVIEALSKITEREVRDSSTPFRFQRCFT